MASANTQIIPYFPPPPSSSESTHQFVYDVFLSFRGDDTRFGFTDHLYDALTFHGFHTFRDDDELQKGGVIRYELQKAIGESKIFVVIFSPNYANSTWCLDELVEISQLNRLILPIFYNVDPSHVRKQTGTYENAFLDHQKQANEEKRDKIPKWRFALTKVGDIAGYDLQNYGYETMLIKEIIDVIYKKLNSKLSLHVSNNMPGMTYHLQTLKSLMEIESNRLIGIHGLGGIGKTTISKVVYNNISHLFESSIFLESIRERSQNYGDKLMLLKEFLNGAIKGKYKKINSLKEGINVIEKRLGKKKLLIILDDVNNSKQLDFLGENLGWFGSSSTIILTSRDERFLKDLKVHVLYKVECLDYNESFQLFCEHAFKQNIPEEDYADLLKDMVKYANGLPLALIVLGSSLHGRSVLYWGSVLQKLKTNPIVEVNNVLKISFEGLNDIQQQKTFLDIACFFRGCHESEVIRLLEHAESDIRVLSEKSLITILDDNTVEMHDLVQEMGREIVRQEHPHEQGKWSRLWDPETIFLVLEKETGTEKIQGIFLDMSKSSGDVNFTTKAFENMKGLRLVKFYWTNHMERQYPKLVLDKDFKFPSYDIRYLHWERYPLESLPSNFDGRELVELNLKHSSIKYLREGKKGFDNLKVIDLHCSEDLVEMPDSARMTNLECLNLTGCDSLGSLPRNFDKLQHLQSLNCSSCSKLKSFPQIQGRMSKLRKINLSRSAIVEVPSSIGLLDGLRYFSLRKCKNLVSLPESIGNLGSLKRLVLSRTAIKELPSSIGHLKALKSLDLSYCTDLENLPDSICHLTSLEVLSLRGMAIKELPSSTGHLKALQSLDLSYCTDLENLPDSICDLTSLEVLNLSGMAIKELPSSIGHLEALQTLDLSNCTDLENLPDSICDSRSLNQLIVEDCSKLEGLTVTEANGDDRNLYCLIVKPGVVWKYDRFSSLKTLNLQYCNQIEAEGTSSNHHHHLPSLSSLVELSVRNSAWDRDRVISTDAFHLSSLQVLTVGNFNPMTGGILSDIFLQSSLQELTLHNCNLMEAGIIPTNILNLSSLDILSLEYCNLREVDILDHISHLSSLIELSLEGNHFSSIPASINRLSNLFGLNLSHCKELQNILELPSNLRGLNLSHCKQLQDIPELPSTLEFLDAHCSDSISSSSSLVALHSLSNGFESKGCQIFGVDAGGSLFMGFGASIVIPSSSGILEVMVRDPSVGSDEVTIELPPNWYENNDLLGFEICCVCVPYIEDDVSYRDGPPMNLDCRLTVSRNDQSDQSKYIGRLSFSSWCDSCDDGISDQILWVIYYPKDAIGEKYRSNEWTHFKASFCCCDEFSHDREYGGCQFFREEQANETRIRLIRKASRTLPIRAKEKRKKRSIERTQH